MPGSLFTSTSQGHEDNLEIVRVQYFVRGGIVWPPLPRSSKHLSFIFRSTGFDSSGVKKEVALQLQDARVSVGSTKDADLGSELRRYNTDMTPFDKLNLSKFYWLEIEEFEMQLIFSNLVHYGFKHLLKQGKGIV
ncbi:hypothetical protein TNCV_3498491 [Trichonephila clavipes]|nr:hypothetical protein TNCV_3498491 [Trichonephila clavipes]